MVNFHILFTIAGRSTSAPTHVISVNLRFSGLWRFCELPSWHLTELVFYKEHKIELVFVFGGAAARSPIRKFSVNFGPSQHTQNFPKTSVLVFSYQKFNFFFDLRATGTERRIRLFSETVWRSYQNFNFFFDISCTKKEPAAGPRRSHTRRAHENAQIVSVICFGRNDAYLRF